MKKMEDDNTLVFICDVKANKRQIQQAVKALYQVEALKINTLIRPDGSKKAYVRLTADSDAMEIANKVLCSMSAWQYSLSNIIRRSDSCNPAPLDMEVTLWQLCISSLWLLSSLLSVAYTDL